MSFTAPTPDIGVPQPPVRPNEVFRFVTQPSAQKGAARHWLTVMLLDAAVTVLAFTAIVTTDYSRVTLWVLAGLGTLGFLIFLMLWTGARTVQGWSGDDLIDLLVLPEGFVTQGGLDISWDEVAKIEAVKFSPSAPKKMTRAEAAGYAAGTAIVDWHGAKTTINIHVFDAKALIERPATKTQKLAIIDAIGSREGFVATQLGFRSGEEMNPLLQHLRQACQQRSKPFEFRESDTGL
ncbi:hypothetical protein O1R50_21840 [Glycomyces luteolus]|uniref:Uncharacterized protein n=1 Tax=Glycomyces luteolus TaxID=2670330 RepID=A0A9X3PEK8_9ACTN|nr:hypothetical protein [Glycomyces luteolus]MDA1362282.1 hypothetical protein [Glycomyces luteolus]